jgi:hypothetical protein
MASAETLAIQKKQGSSDATRCGVDGSTINRNRQHRQQRQHRLLGLSCTDQGGPIFIA